jgi:class 3 adenylate cyclase
VRQLLADARRGRACLLIVTGVPGSGKTAFLHWIGEQLSSEGAQVLRTSGTDAALPLAAVSRLCADMPETLHAIRAGPARAPGTAGGSGLARSYDGVSEHPGQVAAIVGEAVLARSRRRLTGILIDDADELEPSSRDVLRHVLSVLDDAALAGLHLFAAVTSRAPGGLGEQAARMQIARHLELGGLDEHDVFELAHRAGLAPTPELVATLMEGTCGLPLLVDAELARVAAGRDKDVRSPGIRADASRVLTASQAVASRLSALAPKAQGVLARAAALGEPWDVDELVLVCEGARTYVEQAVESAERAGLVLAASEGWRFSHPLVRVELLAGVPEPARRGLHRAIGEKLLLGDPDDELLVRGAMHLLQALPDVTLPDFAAIANRAGEVALRWGAWHQASRLLGAAAEASEETRSPLDTVAVRYLEAGRAAFLDHDTEASEPRLRHARALAEKVNRPDLTVEAALLTLRLQLAEGWAGPGDQLDTADLEQARALPGVDLVTAAEADAILAEALFLTGETDRALTLVALARERLRDADAEPEADYVLARIEFSEGLHRFGRLELGPADACFGRAADHASRAGSTVPDIAARSRRQLIRLLRGDVTAAASDLAGLEQWALDARCWGEAGFAAALRAVAKTLSGDDDAELQLERAARLLHRSGHAYTAAVLAPTRSALDSRTLGLGSQTSDVGPVSSAARALAAVEANDPAAARAVLYVAPWRDGFVGPVSANNMAIAVALVEVGDLLGNADLVAAGRAPLREAERSGLVAALGWPATIPRLLGVVARHGGDLPMAHRCLEHARSVAERERLRPERARVLLELAKVAAAEGASTDAVEALLGAAARDFDDLSMHGWLARCESTARSLDVPGALAAIGASMERTILTTDIVGSTMTNSRLGNALYLEQLRIHDRLLRSHVAQFTGKEIKHTGDGLNVAFDDPADAVRCALAAQREFARWTDTEPELALKIRCGIASGVLIPSGGDFFGLVQSEAARLCALAGEGQVLVSSAVAKDAVPAGLHVEPCGTKQLRGFPNPSSVFRATGP